MPGLLKNFSPQIQRNKMPLSSTNALRIVIFAHGHPRFSPGGGEHAAYALFKQLQSLPNTKAWFVAACDPSFFSVGQSVGSINGEEILIPRAKDDFFYHSNTSLDESSEFKPWILKIQPDILHFHHFAHLGIDLILALLGLMPNARSILTLHEYLTICPYQGQLLRRDGKICTNGPSIHDCIQCVPHQSTTNLFMRSTMMESLLERIDHIIAPSHDLAERIKNYNTVITPITVVENALSNHHQPQPKRTNRDHHTTKNSNATVFGYFGQIHFSKGLHIIIKALMMALRDNPNLYLAIHGTDIYQAGHPDKNLQSYFDYIQGLIEPLNRQIYFHGPYTQDELRCLISNVDWMIMGSLWYENSPVVIQEAYLHKCPLIVPALGGMAEKVRDGIDGYHYTPRSPIDLASQMLYVANNPQKRLDLITTMQEPIDNTEITNSHLKLYKGTADTSI